MLLWASPASALFYDVPEDHPYADAIGLLTRQEVLRGYEDRSFQPERSIDRAEFSAMVARILFPQEYIDTCLEEADSNELLSFSFPDVPRDAWFSPAICALYINGIVDGYPTGFFLPQEGISFVEAAKMLSLAFGLTGIELPNLGAANIEWYVPYVEFLAAQNAIPMTISALNLPVNRSEVAEMIYRLQGYPVTPPPVEHRLSKSKEDVLYPVDWQDFEQYDYAFAFSYPNVWPKPYSYPKGHFDGRIPRYRAAWTVYFGPEIDECSGAHTCVERDMWIDGYSTEDAELILDMLEKDEYFVEVEEEDVIHKMPTIIFLEEVGNCIDKRSLHFGHKWIYSMNIRCGGQDEKLYGIFEQIVKTIKETDEVLPEHRK